MQKIIFDLNVYKLDAVKRSIGYFCDVAYFALQQDGNNVVVEINAKNDNEDLNHISMEIKNKVIEEDIRLGVEEETKTIRDSIYKKALNN